MVVPFVLTGVLAVALAVGQGRGWLHLVDDLLIVALSSFTAACAVMAAKSAEGRQRRAWATMAAAIGAWALADLIWLICEHVLHIDPYPSPADVFYLAFCVLAIPAVLGLAQFDVWSRRQATLRIALDGLTVALCSFLLAWIFALHQVFDTYRDDTFALGLAVFYPVADIVILAVAVAVLARVDAAHRAVPALLVLGFALMTVTDSAFAYAVAAGSYQTGSLIDLGWAGALVAICCASVLSRGDSTPRLPSVLVPSNTALWAPYVPLLLAGTIGPLMVMTGLERYVVPVIVVAVCLRQMVAAWENRQLLRAAAEQAFRDPLTGLANQTLFYDRLAHALMLSSRHGHRVAVVFLDLDDFKLVNDSVGHPEADGLLVKVGQRIADCARAGDTVARMRGDEFALLLEGEHDDSQLIAEHVVDAFDEPFLVHGEQILLRPSVGVAAAATREAQIAPHTLVGRAETAMRTAKRSRSSRVHVFDASCESAEPDIVAPQRGSVQNWPDGAAKIRLLGELRRALDDDELRMVYQPKVDLRSGQIVGVEALLRWLHPRLGLLGPDAFLPLVRQHGLMRPVTDTVLDKAFGDAARWISGGVPMPVAVNLFAPILRDAGLPAALGQALGRRGLPAELLTLEITEDLVLHDFDVVTGVLTQVRGLGIRVAIDDFGSGFSALSYLRELRVDEIKLDRHFISTVTSDPRTAAVVRAVIDLTHDLGSVVVAEGVEDAATVAWLRDANCDVAQGYFFGRPIEAAAVPELVGLPAEHL